MGCFEYPNTTGVLVVLAFQLWMRTKILAGQAAEPAILARFDVLPWVERLFVRWRARTAPLQEIARLVPPGRIAEVGCGHGLLTALLAGERPDRTVIGIDPDPRKISSARKALSSLPNVRFEVGYIAELAEQSKGSFDAVVVADVLYLLPVGAWPDFLQCARKMLRPGGRLFLKEAVADLSWKHKKAIAQEQLVVRILHRTRSSGGLAFQPRERMELFLAQSGFSLDSTLDLSKGYSTPHVLFIATAVP